MYICTARIYFLVPFRTPLFALSIIKALIYPTKPMKKLILMQSIPKYFISDDKNKFISKKGLQKHPKLIM